MRFIPAQRPPLLQLTSLSQLYLDYRRLFLDGADFQKDWDTASGHCVRVFDRNFLHLVKLTKTEAETFTDFFENMQEEKPLICECVDGFGCYQIEERRGRLLPAALDTLLRPHAVVELADPQTAHLAFFRLYEDRRAPGMVTLVGNSKDESCLVPATAYQLRKNQIRSKIFSEPNRVLWFDRDALAPESSDCSAARKKTEAVGTDP